MTMSATSFHAFHDRSVRAAFDTAVSLHSHSRHSREALSFLPATIGWIPVLGSLFRRELSRYRREHGSPIDLARAYWCPPLTARAVVESEIRQIEGRLGMRAFVALTDHDTIDGCLSAPHDSSVPVSFEWTLPFEGITLHLGLYNVPASVAAAVVDDCQGYRAMPNRGRLAELLEHIGASRSTLIVLNHPLWPLHGQDVRPVARFLACFGRWVHALEVNGFRPWCENRAVLVLADRFNVPVVAGGDRHGLMPNALLNLGWNDSFDGYADQIRVTGRNRVLIMPEYREHTTARTIAEIAAVMRVAPRGAADRLHWTDLVFVEQAGEERPLFRGGRRAPLWLNAAAVLTRMAASRPLRPALRAALRSEGRMQVITGGGWPLTAISEL